MSELIGALVVATGLLALVVRDLLVAHGTIVRDLRRHGGIDDDAPGRRDAQSARATRAE